VCNAAIPDKHINYDVELVDWDLDANLNWYNKHRQYAPFKTTYPLTEINQVGYWDNYHRTRGPLQTVTFFTVYEKLSKKVVLRLLNLPEKTSQTKKVVELFKILFKNNKLRNQLADVDQRSDAKKWCKERSNPSFATFIDYLQNYKIYDLVANMMNGTKIVLVCHATNTKCANATRVKGYNFNELNEILIDTLTFANEVYDEQIDQSA
jgi:hypothetical protein